MAGSPRNELMIGVDFDNTIVDYDDLLHSIASDWGVLERASSRNKKAIRDTVRGGPDGEIVWQRLQIAAYGLRMAEAVPSRGVKEFFRVCRENGVEVHIVSHKTIHPNLPESLVNLRDAALAWLDHQGFLNDIAFGIGRSNVHFESSRQQKVARIAALGVTHFIDDLEETFDDPTFPASVAKILYAPGHDAHRNGVRQVATWEEISAHLFPRQR